MILLTLITGKNALRVAITCVHRPDVNLHNFLILAVHELGPIWLFGIALHTEFPSQV